MVLEARPLTQPELERLAARELVEQSHAHYQVDKNPLWAWLATNAAMSAGLAPPQWARDYLAATAKALAELACQAGPPDAAAISRALGLSGTDRSRTPFTELSIIRRDIGLAEYVLALLNTLNPEKKPPRAFRVTAAVKRVVERSGIGEDTVWRAFRRYGKTLAATSGALVEDPQQ